MAPIPRFDEEATALISSIERRREDIKIFHLKRLSEAPLNDGHGVEAREDLDTLTRLVEELRTMIPDQQGEAARRELGRISSQFEAEVTGLRKQVRSALLNAQRASNRSELFATKAKPNDEKESLSTEDALMKANQDVVSTLRRTLNLMQGELERSVLTTQLLDESTRNLESTSDQHTTLTSLLDSSKVLITSLEKTDWLDRILIMLGLLVFGLVCALVIKERIVDRGLRVAFFWTRWLPAPSRPSKMDTSIVTTVFYDEKEPVTSSISEVLESILPTETIEVPETTTVALLYATEGALPSVEPEPSPYSFSITTEAEASGPTEEALDNRDEL